MFLSCWEYLKKKRGKKEGGGKYLAHTESYRGHVMEHLEEDMMKISEICKF